MLLTTKKSASDTVKQAIATNPNRMSGCRLEILEPRVMLSGSSPAGSDNSAAYDASGNLHVAYYDASAHDLKYVVQSKAGAWSQPVVVDQSSSNVGQYVSLAIDASGNVGVAYYDAANSDLKFALLKGSNWTTQVVDAKSGSGLNPSLAFNKSGTALISFYQQGSGDLLLATQGKKKWSITTIANKGDVGLFSSLAINPQTNKAVVAFTGSNGQVQYVQQTGATFTKPVVVGTVTSGDSNLSNVSLAVNPKTGQPSVSYVDTGTGQISVATITPPTAKAKTKVSVTPVATVPAGQDPNATILINPSTGSPEVVYYNSAANGVFVATATPSQPGSGTTFNLQQVSTGGAGSAATIQPGNNSVTVIDTSSNSTNGSPITTQNTATTPLPPTNVAAYATGVTSATVTWSDGSNNETGFLVERSTDGINFTTATTTAANVTSFSDTGLSEGTTYYYRVSAIGAGAEVVLGTTGSSLSALSTAPSAATATTLCAAPTGLAATAAGAGAIDLSWVDQSTHATGLNVERSTDGGAVWNVVGQLSASATDFADTGLTEGTSYLYRVVAYNASGPTPSATASAFTNLATPTGLTATATSTSAVGLTWQDNSQSEGHYVVQRSTDGVNFTTIATLAPNTTSYADSGLSQSTPYYYRVNATGFGDGPADSAYSAVASVTTDPSAPGTLTATAVSNTRITISWVNNAPSATGFVLQRATGNNAFVTLATPAANVTTFNDTGLNEGVKYRYQIQAVLPGTSGSAFSPIVTAYTLPNPPTSLSAATGPQGTQISLGWTDNSVAETGYAVQRQSPGSGTWSTLASLAPNTNHYTDSSSAEATRYSYRIYATGTSGNSAFSNTASQTSVPAAPGSATYSSPDAATLVLNWVNNSQGATGFNIFRSTDGTQFSLAGGTGAGVTTFTDTGLDAGTVYTYEVFANDAGGVSAPLTFSALTAPAAPSGVTATASSTTSVDLAWTASDSAISYTVQRAPAGASPSWNTVASVPASQSSDGTSFLYSDLVAEGSAYQYQVLAINSGGTSTPGGPATVTTPPAAPAGLTATGSGPNAVNLTWTNNSDGATGVEVLRGATSSGLTLLTTLPASSDAFSDTSVIEGTTYYYQVLATDTGGDSDPTNTAQVTTVPAAPSNVTAVPASSTSVVINWNNNSDSATGNEIDRSTDFGASWTSVGQAGPDDTSFTDTTASAGTGYAYRVQAIGTGGVFPSSSYSTTTPPAAPTVFSATETSSTSVNLTWDSVNSATGYIIERAVASQSPDFEPIATPGQDDTQYTDANAVEGTTYLYELVAVDAGGNSDPSSAQTVTTAPGAPTNLTAGTTTSTSVVLSWSDNSATAAGYSVESSSNGGNFSAVIQLGAGTGTYTATITEGTTTSFRVQAVGVTGIDNAPSSDYSNTVTVNAPPAAADGLSATSISLSEIDLSWSNISANDSAVYVERFATDGQGNPTSVTLLGPLSTTATSYHDTGLSEATKYAYKIQTATASASNQSEPYIFATTRPAGPTGLSAAIVDAGVALAWTDNSANETGYHIYRAVVTDGTAGTPALIDTEDAGVTSYTDSTAQAGTTYSYNVAAYNAAGESASAGPTTATTLPAAPGNVTAVAISTTRVNLSWSDVAGETGFFVQRSTNGTDWTTLPGGTLSQGQTTFADTTAQESSIYQYQILAVNSSGDSPASQPASATTFLAAPTTLSAVTAGPNEIDLSWTNNSGVDTGYEVWRGTGANNLTLLTPIAANSTTYPDHSAAEGTTYYYQVRATGTNGHSDFSDAVHATTQLYAPTGLAATQNGTSEIDLSWTAPTSLATGYGILRSTDNIHFSPLATVPASAISNNTGNFADTTAAEGTTYWYQVQASDTTSTSVVSTTASARTLPAAPSGLTATGKTYQSISLNWVDNSQGANGYSVLRYNGTTYASIATLGVSATSYTDTALTQNTAYQYEIEALSTAGPSTPTSSITVTTPPQAATVLVASQLTATTVTLSWTDNSGGAAGYYVQQSTGGGSFVTIATLGNAGTAPITGLSEATAYQFQVVAFGSGGSGAASNAITVTTVPAAPGGLVATPMGTTDVRLTWVNHSAGEAGFNIMRSPGDGTWASVGTVDSATTTFDDTTVAEGTSYLYNVVATDAGGNSQPTSTVSALTYAAAPSSLAATPGASSVTLTWNDNSHAEAGFRIERADQSGQFGVIHTVGPNDGSTDSYTDSSASPAANYQYKVVSYNDTGDSTDSNIVSVLTTPAAPANPSATAASDQHVNLTWTSVTGATGYTIQRATGSGAFASVGFTTSNGATQFSDTDTTLAEATAYSYQVLANNASGSGAASVTADTTTLPSDPAALSLTPVSAGEVDLAWTNVSAAADGIEILRSTNGTDFTQVGTTLDPTTASYQDTTVSGGTDYTYKVVATFGDLTSAGATTASTLTIPAAVQNLTATVSSDTHLSLTWDASTGATSYLVEVADGSGGWTTLNSVSTNSFPITNATESTSYTYRVTPSDSTGSGLPQTVTAVTLPTAPAGLTASVASATEVDLSWTDASTHASGYLVDRSANGGDFGNVATLGPGVTTYNDTLATEATSYVYRVTPFNSVNADGVSIEQSAYTPPAAPTGLVATPVSAGEIDLSFTNNSSGETGFDVLRNGVNIKTLASIVGTGSVTYNDTTVSGGTAYQYQVIAVGGGGSSLGSNVQTVTTVPAAPASVAAQTVSTGSITVTWSAVSGATSYRVEELETGTWTAVQTLTSPATTYTVTGLSEATLFQFHVVATDATGDSAASSSSSATTLPAAPDTLVATPVSAGEIDLTWLNHSSGATGVQVWRATGAGTATQLGSTLSASTSSFHDTSVAGGTSYTYYVVAVDAGGSSAQSNSQTALTVPAAPTSLAVTPANSTQLNLTWTASVGATTYTVARSGNNGDTWTTLTTTLAATSYNDAGVNPGSNYVYTVSATDATGTGAAATQNAMTPPAAPTSVTALQTAPPTTNAVNLSWSTVTGATGYTIVREIGNAGYVPLTTVGNVTGYTDTAVAYATSYTYRVAASDSAGLSSYTQSSQVTTVPAAPTGVQVTAYTDTGVTVGWQSVTGATGYLLMRSGDGGNTWSQIGSTLAANATSATDSTVSPATPYLYEVVATDGSLGAPSNSVAVTTLPTAPTNVAVSAVNSNSITLTWSDTSGLETGFTVQVQQSDQSWALASTSQQNVLTATITNLSPNTAYTFRVLADNSAAMSLPSGTVTHVTAPAAPSGLTSTIASDTEIDLTWSAVTGATAYRVYRSNNGGAFTQVGSDITNASNYNDTSLSPASNYAYEVTSVSAAGEGNPSSTGTLETTPAAPTGFIATPVSAGEIDLGWNPVTGATSYTVTRSDANWTQTVDSTHTSVHDTTVGGGTSYTYSITASDLSGPSAAASASALTVPVTPGGLTVTSFTTNTVNLSWSSSTGAAYYVVERSLGDGSSLTTLNSNLSPAGGGTQTCSDTNAASGTAYIYYIIAHDTTGDSVTASVNQTTLPAAPQNFLAAAVTAGPVNLSWNAVTGASGSTAYTIQRSVSGGSFAFLANTNSATTSYQDTSVSSATHYTYRILANGTSGSSAWSVTISALTVPAATTIAAPDITGTSNATLTWSAVTAAAGYKLYTSTNDSTWDAGTDLGNVTTRNLTGLSESATTYYKIDAYNSTGNSLDSNVATVTTLPGAPSGLAVASVSAATVSLSWTNNSAHATGVQVFYNNGGTLTAASGVLSPSTSTFVDGNNGTALAAGTSFTYVVQAIDSSGNSDNSNSVTALTLPAAVTGLTATSNIDTSVTLMWTATTGATSYTVERKAAGASDSTYANVSVSGNPGSATTLSDTTTAANTSYVYEVIASNSSGSGAAATTGTVLTIPAAPASLTATPVSATEIDLAWNSDGAAGSHAYIIQRSVNGGNFVFLAYTASATTSYADTSVSAATTYAYRVLGNNASGHSLWSTTGSVLTVPAATTIATPTITGTTTASLAWSTVTGATGYKLYSSTNNSTWDAGIDLGNVISKNLTGLSESSTTYYKVDAYNATGNSADSNTVTVTTLPAAPSVLTVSGVSATTASLSWTNNSANATGVQVFYDNGGTLTAASAVLSPSASTFVDGNNGTALSTGSSYTYVVQAIDASGNSASSNSVTALTLPAAVTGLTATPNADNSVTLTWTAATGATSYAVERKAAGADVSTYAAVNVSGNPGSAVTLSDTTTAADTSYDYEVIASNSSGSGAPATTGDVLTTPAAPTGFTASAASASEIALVWNSVTGATNYTITRSNDNWTTTQPVTTLDATSYNDTGVSGGVTWQYRITASNASGASTAASASALTVPASPSGLTATDHTTSEIDLGWNASIGAAYYIIQRSNPDGSNLTTLDSDLTPANGTPQSYADSTAASGTSYTYNVIAFDTTGDSVTASVNASTLPAAPQNVQASPISATEIDLSWNAVTGAAGSQGYTIQRSISGGDFAFLTYIASGTTSYHDAGLTAATQYSYQVLATGAGGSSAWSQAASETSFPAATTISTPTITGTTTATLAWSAVTGASGYILFTSTDDSTWDAGTDLGNVISKNLTGLSESSTTYYKVDAYNTTGNSADSNIVTVVTLPAAPSGLTVASVSATTVSLSWTNNSANATGVQVFYDNDGTLTAASGVLDPSTTTFEDGNNGTALSTGTSYTYVVQAIDASGNSVSSNSVTALTLPAAVTSLTATPNADNSVTLTWNASTSATAYTVERKIAGANDSTYTSVSGTPASANSGATLAVSDTGTAADTSYVYEVVASNASGTGAATTTGTVLTTTAAPTGFTASPFSAGQTNLFWNAVTGATSYTVTRSDGNWSDTVDSSNLAVNDTTVSGGTSYTYNITASDASGPSTAASASVLTVPASPSGLTVSSFTATTVNLSWSTTTGAAYYVIKRSLGDGSALTTLDSELTPTDGSTQAYADTTAASGTAYIYSVYAHDATGDGGAATVDQTTLPAAPQNLATTLISDTEIDLTWDAVTGATSYTIERTVGDNTVDANSNTNTFNDTGLTAATGYSYQVVANGASGSSDASTALPLTTLPSAPVLDTPSITGTTTATLTWSAVTGATSYILYTNTGGGWDAGTDIGNVTTKSLTGLTESSTTSYKLDAVDVTGNSADSNTVTVTTLPAAPSGLAATSISATTVSLSWTNNAADATGVQVFYDNNGTLTAASGVLNPSTTTFEDGNSGTALSTGTSYTYVVEAIDASGNSASSNSVTALTLPADITGLTATANADNSITLTWNASTGADQYFVYRTPANQNNGFAALSPSDSNGEATSYTDHTTAANSTYSYRVIAGNTTGWSSGTTTDPVLTTPAAPANLAVTPVSAAENTVAWDANAGATDGFIVEVSEDGGTYAAVQNQPASGATGYTDNNVTGGHNYAYKVFAVNNAGNSTAATGSTQALPAAPTASATPTSPTSTSVSWNAVYGATDYTLYTSVGGGAFDSGTDVGNSTGYSLTALSEATNYAYKVVAIDSAGNSAVSNTASTETLSAPATNLAAASVTTTGFTLNWLDGSNNETGFVVQQQTGSNPAVWTNVATASAVDSSGTSVSAAVSGLTEGLTYAFRVDAQDNGGDSYSSPINVTTLPDAPTGLAATATSATGVQLTWTGNSTNAASYIIDRKVGNGSMTYLTTVSNTGTGSFTYDDTVTEGNSYQYNVYAATTDSTASSTDGPASVSTPPAAASSVSAAAVSPTEIDLAWTNNSASPAGFNIWRLETGGSWTKITSVGSGATSYNDTNAPEDASTRYKVVTYQTVNSVELDAADSNVASATTPLAAPSSLVATANSDTSVGLTWTDNSTVATGYEVYRKLHSGSTWTNLTLSAPLASNVDSYTDTTVTENVHYDYKVFATDSNNVTSDYAGATVTTPLSVPTGLAVTAKTDTTVSLSWTNVSVYADTISILRSPSGQNTFTQVGTTSASGSAGSYTDTQTTEGTAYDYEVQALLTTGGGNASAGSGSVTVTTRPTKPTGLAASVFSSTEIDLTWTDQASGAVAGGYDVLRSGDSGVTWTDLTPAGQSATLANTAASFSDTTGAEGTTYEYEVNAVGTVDSGASAESATASSTTLPATPTGISANDVSATSVTVNWTDNSNNETAYEVDRSTDGNSWTTLTSALPANTISYTDTAANEATSYYYRVRAIKTVNSTAFNGAYDTMVATVTTIPAAPTNLIASTPSAGKVVLNWSDNSNGETGYSIQRSLNGGSYSLLTTLAANSISFSDSSVLEGNTYSYQVWATNSAGASLLSNAASAVTSPAAPSGLGATAVAANLVNLSWTDNSAHSPSFEVQRSSNGGSSWTSLTTVSGGTTTYSDTTTSEAATYQYRVRAFSTVNSTNYYSNFGLATGASTPLNTPTNEQLSATATSVTITWTNTSAHAGGYTIDRSTVGGPANPQQFTVSGSGTTTYTDTTAQPGTTYAYTIEATRTGNQSAFTAAVNVTTPPTNPSNLSATAQSDTNVALTWTGSSGETAYTIQRSINGGSTWNSITTTVASGATSYTDSTASEETAYLYEIEATGPGGKTSIYTTSNSVTTLPAAPSGTTATAQDPNTVEITWTNNSQAVTGFQVWRSDNGGSYAQVGAVAANTFVYDDPNLTEGFSYGYEVRAVDAGRYSTLSAPSAVVTPPDSPASLAATAASTTSINLTWTDVSTHAAGYTVERSSDGGTTFQLVATLPGVGVDSYTDTALTEATNYQYRIRAYNTASSPNTGYSDYSLPALGNTLPATPTNLVAVAAGGHINLTWNDNSSGEDGYQVWRTAPAGSSTLYASLPADSNSYSDTAVTGGSSYTYVVYASLNGSLSAASNSQTRTA